MKTSAKMIKALPFPQSGDFFAVAFIDKEVDEVSLGGVVTKRLIVDRSYREHVFQCLESDATRVIGRIVHGNDYSGGPHIFHRSEWRMDDVNHLLPSLGFAVTEKELSK